MAARAVRCFRRQTYHRKVLLMHCGKQMQQYWSEVGLPDGVLMTGQSDDHLSIGALRNEANSAVATACGVDIIVHFDDDDISHPNRIADQVALLQLSGADCVGYREMLFWRTADDRRMYEDHDTWDGGQSWIYRHSHPNYCLGTSLCYWRKAWENCKFPPTSRGEDLAFVQRVRALGVPGVNGEGEPRMVATIHGSNTSESYDPRLMEAKEEWRRTPEWDDAVRKMLEEA